MSFKVDQYVLETKENLATYLVGNFRKSIALAESGKLFEIIKAGDENLYNTLVEKTKDFEYSENILTLTIFFLDNKVGIFTPNYHFHTSKDIAFKMKEAYPKVIDEIKVLFSDQVLVHIFWNLYETTGDVQYKRYYTFLLHVYENRMYDFTYYYFLFLHLERNEHVRFHLDGVRMQTLDEVATHIINNRSRASYILEEAIENPIILASIAKESSIDLVSSALYYNNNLLLLKALNVSYNYDFIPIIKGRMAYWMLSNYDHYAYNSPEAKAIYQKYKEFKSQTNLDNLNDYLNVYKEAHKLFVDFVDLFEFNKLVKYKSGIEALDEDYYLSYNYNDEIVCKKFLVEFNLFDEKIHTDVYKDNVEREVLTMVLDKEQEEIEYFKNEVKKGIGSFSFDKKENHFRRLILSMNIWLLACSVLVNYISSVIDNKLVYYGIIVAALLSQILSLVYYYKKEKSADLVLDFETKSDSSIKIIEKQKELILNKEDDDDTYETLQNLRKYRGNREHDLESIKKIANGYRYKRFPLVISKILSVFGVIAIYSALLLELLGKAPINLTYFGFNFYFLAYGLVNAILVLIFRKQKWVYFMEFAFIAVLIGVSFIF